MRAKPDVVCGVTASGRGSEIEGSRGGGEQDREGGEKTMVSTSTVIRKYDRDTSVVQFNSTEYSDQNYPNECRGVRTS